MEAWRKCFGLGIMKIFGMVHVPALPGTPKNSLKISEIVAHVKREAAVYARSDIDAVLVENMHDVPYLHPSFMGPEVTAAMTRICLEIRSMLPKTMPCGVQVLASANEEALAVAQAAELQFIRCEGFVFGHIADEGWTNSCAAQLMRYRKKIGADEILVFCDIKKKHSSHMITADVDIAETAVAAEFFLADGVIVTGSGTGHAADVTELAKVKEACSHLPVLIGSGVTAANVEDFRQSDGLIIGSHFKENGRWDQNLQEEKITKLMAKVKQIRATTENATS